VTVRTRHHNAAAHREEIADQVNTNTTDISTLETQSPTLGTEVDATNSGADDLTVIDFTGIPSWVQKITIELVGVSTNGTSDPLIQIGDSGGIEDSGYLGASSALGGSVSTINYTAGFGLNNSSGAAAILHGVLNLTKEGALAWVANGTFGQSNAAAMVLTAGSKSLSAVLTQLRITTAGGSDAFDAGTINILYS